MSLQISGKRG